MHPLEGAGLARGLEHAGDEERRQPHAGSQCCLPCSAEVWADVEREGVDQRQEKHGLQHVAGHGTLAQRNQWPQEPRARTTALQGFQGERRRRHDARPGEHTDAAIRRVEGPTQRRINESAGGQAPRQTDEENDGRGNRRPNPKLAAVSARQCAAARPHEAHEHHR